MNTRIALKNQEHNPHVEEYIAKELEKVHRLLQPADATIYIDMVLDVEGVDHRMHRVELRVHDKHGDLSARDVNRDQYLAIAHAVKKMVEELEKGKSKRLDLRDKPYDQPHAPRKDKYDFEK